MSQSNPQQHSESCHRYSGTHIYGTDKPSVNSARALSIAGHLGCSSLGTTPFAFVFIYHKGDGDVLGGGGGGGGRGREGVGRRVRGC